MMLWSVITAYMIVMFRCDDIKMYGQNSLVKESPVYWVEEVGKGFAEGSERGGEGRVEN